MKIFVKVMDKIGDGFRYHPRPRISEAKINEGIFVDPQIRVVLNDADRVLG